MVAESVGSALASPQAAPAGDLRLIDEVQSRAVQLALRYLIGRVPVSVRPGFAQGRIAVQ